jgi:hypothetical protein
MVLWMQGVLPEAAMGGGRDRNTVTSTSRSSGRRVRWLWGELGDKLLSLYVHLQYHGELSETSVGRVRPR